ncbi:FkbM family methyltransferase [Parerythrobacter aestuarii]|uniref:FkbM family methyltransferase n=1 Tax=Parerythrobacter aestuarii TaxID=3020909 RepID=UPI0024DE4C15|nr:FkbM family methyltransferase [Parerythrobacter aestuarii]
MDYSSDWILRLRGLGQRLGILRPMQRAYRALFRIDYEEAFDSALKARIRPGDTVWDVGANIGHYAPQFAAMVGPQGKVVAVEPSPSSLSELRQAIAACANVVVEEIALSNESGEAEFYLSTEGASANEGLSAVGSDGGMVGSRVPVLRGEELARRHAPNVIKVDVEGFELEVIEGLGVTLHDAGLHTVAIEVHFQTLARRGRSDAPKRLSALLQDAGFGVRWTDPSHLVASR